MRNVNRFERVQNDALEAASEMSKDELKNFEDVELKLTLPYQTWNLICRGAENDVRIAMKMAADPETPEDRREKLQTEIIPLLRELAVDLRSEIGRAIVKHITGEDIG